MIEETLFDDGKRSWHFFGRDPHRPERVIDTNEFLVVDGDAGVMLDAGGMEVFPAVVTAVSQRIPVAQIESFFASHQDPDILSALALWVGVCPHAKVWVPRIWETFMTHFSFEANFETISDEGGILPLGHSRDLQLVPAHYLHSSANFSVYDPVAKILWSGDIGSSLLPPGDAEIWVSDFDRHIALMDGFHRRWMPSEPARDRWLDRVRGLDVEMLVPQHGKLFAGDDVDRFYAWFAQLPLASALR